MIGDFPNASTVMDLCNRPINEPSYDFSKSMYYTIQNAFRGIDLSKLQEGTCVRQFYILTNIGTLLTRKRAS